VRERPGQQVVVGEEALLLLLSMLEAKGVQETKYHHDLLWTAVQHQPLLEAGKWHGDESLGLILPHWRRWKRRRRKTTKVLVEKTDVPPEHHAFRVYLKLFSLWEEEVMLQHLLQL
jgi:hypothetical protein